ncbi:hypothetical protein [Roseibium litorale]|uniref:Uncharacterized protein n=1 Tax=Roseibium litorale TaxID=2803841 RepID=A0ABR9CH52_9HYPH|nr:hypothetical protein [Roseibium litorale]MBD8890181.1 hypothetical protein [Roseibium litorale]
MTGAKEPLFPRLPHVPSPATLTFLELDRLIEAASRWGLTISGASLCAFGLAAGILVFLR